MIQPVPLAAATTGDFVLRWDISSGRAAVSRRPVLGTTERHVRVGRSWYCRSTGKAVSGVAGGNLSLVNPTPANVASWKTSLRLEKQGDTEHKAASTGRVTKQRERWKQEAMAWLVEHATDAAALAETLSQETLYAIRRDMSRRESVKKNAEFW